MYWFSYGNREIPYKIRYKIDTIGNPYINHPRASQALHTRVATCHTHIGVPHVCHMRAHHAPRLAPTILLLDSSIGLSPLYSGFQKIKISTISIFQPGLGSSRPTRTRGPPTHPPTRVVCRHQQPTLAIPRHMSLSLGPPWQPMYWKFP